MIETTNQMAIGLSQKLRLKTLAGHKSVSLSKVLAQGTPHVQTYPSRSK